MGHPISGPISPEELKALAELPYGQAIVELRKHDPMFGRAAGDKIKWKVRFTQRVTMEGFATVEAETEEEATKLANDIPDSKIVWDECDTDYSEIDYVEPA